MTIPEISEYSFEDFMLKRFNLGKNGFDWSIGDLFKISMEEVEQTLTTSTKLFKIEKRGLKTIHFDSIRSEIQKEMYRLSCEIEPDLYAKIELLVQAAFIAGQETEAYGAHNLIPQLKSRAVKKIVAGGRVGTSEKHNKVLVQAIKSILGKKPDIGYSQLRKELITKAKDDFLREGKYTILFMEKGEDHYGKILDTDSLVCLPAEVQDAPYGQPRPISIKSLRRYYDNVKKKTW